MYSFLFKLGSSKSTQSNLSLKEVVKRDIKKYILLILFSSFIFILSAIRLAALPEFENQTNPEPLNIVQESVNEVIIRKNTAPKYTGQNKVNPGSLILSAEMMLRHMGWTKAADLIISSMEKTILAKKVTYDFERMMDGADLVSCSGFGEEMVKRM